MSYFSIKISYLIFSPIWVDPASELFRLKKCKVEIPVILTQSLAAIHANHSVN